MKIGKYRLKDIVNPKKWWATVYGYFLKWLYPEHYLEQYFLRKTTEECKPCVDAGYCLTCGCDIQAKMRVPKEACALGFWGEYLSKEEYEEQKKKWDIRIVAQFKEY